MKYLVTGGAGYIGSHMVKKLIKSGHEVKVIDDLSTGNEWAVSKDILYKINLLDTKSLLNFFENNKIDGVFHFAAKSIVSESIIQPNDYYLNNVAGSINLVNAMIKNKINKIIFSSTAAVYGSQIVSPISEKVDKIPINPYGKSKLMIENIIKDMSQLELLQSISFRYFNAAGASFDTDIGEAHKLETHLIPNIINSYLNKKSFKIFGNSFNTNDGFAVRDYIHVEDICDAHLLGMEHLHNSNNIYEEVNLGSGIGYSVKEILDEIEKIIKNKISYVIDKPRKGDPDTLIADINKAYSLLNWIPKYNLNQIIKTAIDWHIKYQNEKH